VEAGSLIEVLKHVYGLGDGPFRWNRHLDAELKALGYVSLILEVCLYLLFDNGRLIGVLGLATDDFFDGGEEQHAKDMEHLRKKYKFGKWAYRKGRFCGRDVEMDENFRITMSQAFYLDGKEDSKIFVSRERRREREALCTASEITSLRAVIGILLWVAGQTRIDVAGKVALLQQCFPDPKVEDLLQANRCLSEAIAHKDLAIILHPIPPERLRVGTTFDAAWGNARDVDAIELNRIIKQQTLEEAMKPIDEKQASQGGYIHFFTDEDLFNGKRSPITFVSWKSHRIKRKTPSTLSAESQMGLEGSSSACWIRFLLESALTPNWDHRQ
jgi:hypothetical protein